MSNPAIRLTDPIGEPSGVLFFERRRSQRRAVSGRVTAVISGSDPAGTWKRICSIQLINQSTTGLGALSQEPLAVGSQVTLFFPPHGPEHGFDLRGTIVRDAVRESGYEIGIRLEERLAA